MNNFFEEPSQSLVPTLASPLRPCEDIQRDLFSIQSSITHSFNTLSVGEIEWYGKKVLGSSPSSITNSPSDLEQISGPQFPHISNRKSRFMISKISSCICDNCRVRIGQEVSKCH